MRRASRPARSSSIHPVISSIWCRVAARPSATASALGPRDSSGPAVPPFIPSRNADWYPTAEMLERKPEIRPHMVQLRSGLGMKGGPENPIGARALYLWSGNKDTLYRIHGTNEPWTIGTNVSSGCIRLTNEDIVDLYNRARVGTKVVVLNTAPTGTLPFHVNSLVR